MRGARWLSRAQPPAEYAFRLFQGTSKVSRHQTNKTKQRLAPTRTAASQIRRSRFSYIREENGRPQRLPFTLLASPRTFYCERRLTRVLFKRILRIPERILSEALLLLKTPAVFYPI
ncbi:hypothetical protein NDU88_001362 [Pleurodeles waltl]|uniref:Uncharacterized protein n=1 Tax=Pleurodeles waltl TaxID=8319 RepID=A0AAV7P6Y8_PLEWA|nr:hypothetical protein NDU88_001362 [Pleurodeles waltl]